MGAGKTTIGRSLAERIGYRFIDNDAGIEAEYDATGAQLAGQLGVEGLHRIEADQLANALGSFGAEPVVIAAAASVVDDEAGRALLEDHSVVWLDASPTYLAGRLGQDDHRRKLGTDPLAALVRQSDERRQRFTAIANITVAVEGRLVQSIVEEIIRHLTPLPRAYTDLAGWFHLMTAPADYAGEAAFYLRELATAATRPIETILELGSGGGNNASHMKQHASLTLVDLSPPMLELSKSINPECEHLVADMRTVRLGRRFDAVFVHDAVDYLTTVEDLAAAVETAALHCRPGGAVLFAPDDVVETFRPATSSGGHRDETRSFRYDSRAWDPDPNDSTYLMEMTYRLEEEGQPTRVVEDLHILGLFPRATWLELFRAAHLVPTIVPSEHSEQDHVIDVFVATPEEGGAG
jgi:shikimate kinase